MNRREGEREREVGGSGENKEKEEESGRERITSEEEVTSMRNLESAKVII